MNRNRKIRAAAVALSTGVLISTASAEASPLAGAVASMVNIENTKTEVVIEEQSPLSGIDLAIANMVAQAEIEATLAPVEVVEEPEVAPVETPVKTGEFDNVAIATVSDYVNIRSNPDAESELVGKLYSCGAAQVTGYDGDWVEITSGNVVGYVLSDYLTIGDEELCKKHSKILARSTTDNLNIRSEASTDSSVMKQVDEGDKVQVISLMREDEDWIEVKTNKGLGYMASDYVTIAREYNGKAESVEEERARIAREEAQKKAKEEAAKKSSGKKSTKSTSSSKGSGSSSGKTYAAPSGQGGTSVANFATQFVGNPYVYGGSSLTNGTDCSGFVMSVYNQFGISLPHSSSAQRSAGRSVSVNEMQPGDIVCYSGHVGIYVGNGNIVHASTKKSGIKVSSAYYRNILSVRRIFD